uniref:ubiquitinyl hydrolase 1 n=2 Tax=Schistocephalus solidus TaxID=70667 RepID=A0A0X3P9K3_SCHSO
MVDIIYHEKQQGFFCAQHCLNNLLQGQYFTAGDLADIAHQLDVQERAALGQTPSGTSCLNSDATGFFSVQVIIQALRNLGLEVVPLLRKCPEAEAAREDPTQQVAFICHFMQHWFTIRKLGYQWFDLNSMLSRPKLISDTYLSLYLAQLRQEGNSIYFVTGNIPECEADRYLRVHPVPQDYLTLSHSGLSSPSPTEDPELTTALNASVCEADATDPSLQQLLQQSDNGTEDEDLARAIALSLETYPTSVGTSGSAYGSSERTVDPLPGSSYVVENNTSEPSARSDQADPNELRRKRMEFYARR